MSSIQAAYPQPGFKQAGLQVRPCICILQCLSACSGGITCLLYRFWVFLCSVTWLQLHEHLDFDSKQFKEFMWCRNPSLPQTTHCTHPLNKESEHSINPATANTHQTGAEARCQFTTPHTSHAQAHTMNWSISLSLSGIHGGLSVCRTKCTFYLKFVYRFVVVNSRAADMRGQSSVSELVP